MRRWILSLLLCLLIIPGVYASSPREKILMAHSFTLYKKGDYPETIKQLQKIRSKDLMGTRYYLEGLCQSRLQNFDIASKRFQIALRYHANQEDIYYELGQADYANNDLEKAIKFFKRSYKKGYKKATSLYYMAYISQILEKFLTAKNYYHQLTQLGSIDNNLKQIAQFQLAEVLTSLNQNKQDNREIVKKYIMPQYKKALKIDEGSDLSVDIQKRIKELNVKYRLDPNIMINGRTLPKKSLTAQFYQKFIYDDNVTLETDLPTTTATQKDSFILDSYFLLRYQMPFYNRYVITPELKGSFKMYGDRENSDIYQNDSLFIAPSIKTRLEHTAFGKMASFLFNIQHNVTNRDREKKKDRIFYGRSTTYVVGEKFRYFSFGDTTIKLKYKSYTAYDSSLDYGATTLQINQLMLRKNGHIGLFMFLNDMTRMDQSSTSDTDSYLFRGDYIIPNYFKGYDLHFGLSFTLLDTKLQRDTRGWEKTLSPSVELSRKINKNLAYTLLWEYTKNSSDSDVYNYEKQVLTFQVKLLY